MRQNDKIIGRTVFGWTDEQTQKNDWYDEFFGLWRPKPASKDDLYPSWSSSGKFATQLIEELIKNDVEINISQSYGQIAIQLSHRGFDGEGYGDTFPEALAESVINISFYWPAIENLKEIERALRHE